MRKTAAYLATGFLALISAFIVHGARSDTPTYQWSSAGALRTARLGACAALLPDGSVLITGGKSDEISLATAERLVGNESLEAAPMSYARADHACVALSDGRVLVAGGTTSGGVADDDSRIGVTFYLTATESVSGRPPQTTFTDGKGDVDAKASI